MWSAWFTFDESDDADPLRLANKLGQLDAQVGELQRNGIATPTVTVEVKIFLTGDGKGMCARHTKLKCRCWHCDLAFEDFGGDNLCRSEVMISIRWGAFLRSIPPTRRVGDMVHCCCRIANAIFKRLCFDGQISQARALGPLLRNVGQSVMQATAHIPLEMRDAPRPTKDGNFGLAGGRWFARDQANHAKVVQLIQQHVGPQERVVVGGTSTWACVHSGWFAVEYRNFYISSSIPTERRNVEFKMDIRHSFLGNKISRPYFSPQAFTHVLALDALDVGLQMWHALHDTKDKKRRIGRRKA